jgi:hypothetical protein
MKQLLAIAAFATSLVATSSALAGGFSCLSVDRNERMDVFFEALEDGHSATRLVILDPTVSKSRQHVATFKAEDGVLKTEGRTVHADVDTSIPNSSRKGERVGGTTLGALRSIELEIDLRQPFARDSALAAQATYTKHSGFELTQDFDCVSFEGSEPPSELYF